MSADLSRVLAATATGVGAAALVLPEAVGLGRTPYRPMVVPFRPVLSTVLIALGAGLLATRPTWPAGVAVAAVGAVGAGGLVASAGNHRAGNHRGGNHRGGESQGPADACRPLRVLSANVLQGRADPDALAVSIRDHRPDVVVLPEAGDRFRRRLARRIPPGYRSWSSGPGRAADRRSAQHPDGTYMTVFVAEHLGDVAVRDVEHETVHGWLEVRGGGFGTARLLAVHPVAPYLHRNRQWAAELALLGHELAVPGTVVAGDLNATLEHAELRAVLQGATSATATAGRSRVGTWPAGRPRWMAIGIDHVLAGPGVVARTATILEVPGSDHRAVLADLRY